MKRSQVEVIVGGMKGNPSCAHGPTILFERVVKSQKRRFYACSADRNRKDCSFFLWADEKITEGKRKAWQVEKLKLLPKIQHQDLYNKYVSITELPKSERLFCCSCNQLLLSKERNSHGNHQLKVGLTDKEMTNPSKLFRPLERSRKEAQYLFSPQTVETLTSMLKSAGSRNVLCIGSPSVHEYILNECKETTLSSLMLDIDWRYHQFYSPLQFCWYNMFNHHFFLGSSSEGVYKDFLQQNGGEGIAVIMDPPFGGRAEILAYSLQRIEADWRKLNNVSQESRQSLQIFWIFPYFMEPYIKASLPDVTMLDFKVDYINHLQFCAGLKGRKQGSPVRVFTNVPPQKIPLPAEDGYHFCSLCARWVSAENKHCYKCNACTSKNGQSYVHCDQCQQCVKPSWQHCASCDRCCLKDHPCKILPQKICSQCGGFGHKWSVCPQRSTVNTVKQNKQNVNQTKSKKRKKKTFNMGRNEKLKKVKHSS